MPPDETTETAETTAVPRDPAERAARPATAPRPREFSADPDPALSLDEARRRRIRPWAIAGAVLVVIATGSVALSYTSVFGARVIEVEGEEHLGPRRVMRLAGVERGTNVVHLDTAVAEARLEGEPWVLEATVQTVLPGTIRIEVLERRPALIVERDGAKHLVAADGTILGRAGRSVALPEVVPAPGEMLGPSAVATAGEVVRAMAPALRTMVASVLVSADGRVDLIVDGGVDVRFGTADAARAKGRALRAILAYADEQGRRLVLVDLSAPAAPTARFADSQQVASVPDPSADVPATVGDAGDAASPSP